MPSQFRRNGTNNLKVEIFVKDSQDSIPSTLPSVKIQIMGGKSTRAEYFYLFRDNHLGKVIWIYGNDFGGAKRRQNCFWKLKKHFQIQNMFAFWIWSMFSFCTCFRCYSSFRKGKVYSLLQLYFPWSIWWFYTSYT